jgi:hypothetical protein
MPTALNSLRPAARTALALVLVVGMTTAGATNHASEMLARAKANLTANAMARHVQVLADDSFEGREAGKRGGRAAAAYIVEQIENLGFEPAGDNGTYFQSFGSNMRNILALLPGSDPTLAGEYVIVGAHYDHVGYGNARNSYGPYGQVHNGADDNASGVAAVIELMRALHKLPDQPRRSLLIGFWDGEEKGLLGSAHFVRVRPKILADKTPVFCLNLDMVGRLRDRRVEVFGARTSPGLRSLLVATNNTGGDAPLSLAFDWDITEDSDHYSFISGRIPTVMLHTGLHDQYHRPSDDIELVNNDGIRDVAGLTLALAFTVANADASPVFRQESRAETNATRRRLEASVQAAGMPRGRWGIVSREDPCEPTSPIVATVVVDSPASKAGLQRGDRLMAIDDVPIRDHAEAVARLRSIERSCTLQIDRNGMVKAVVLEASAGD